MRHPFFTTAATTRAEALRWLAIAEKLLSAHDLLGSKSFATRARDSDPTLSEADDILAVVDTLLAGNRRVGNNQPDWYAILRLSPAQDGAAELIANQCRGLVLLLNPQRNKFPFAEQALRLVFEACSVLSNPSRKSLYDKELAFSMLPPPPTPPPTPPPPQQQQQPNPFNDPIPTWQQNFMFFGGGATSSVAQPPVHGGESSSLGAGHYAQVHTQPQVGPVVGGSTREPQNFMGFTSGYDFVFGSGSGSKSSYEPVSNQIQESYSTFAGNVASASGANQVQFNDFERKSQQNYTNVSDETIHDVPVSENVGEDIEDVEEIDEEGERNVDEEREVGEERVDAPVIGDGSPFWTACPYCYYMYEYPRVYVDCTLRCQNCKRGFQAVVIPSPPPTVDGQEGYYCCWGFLPFGFSVEDWKKHNVATSGWTPFTPMFSCVQMGNNVSEGVGGLRSLTPRNYVSKDEVVELSDSSDCDNDWQDVRDKREKNKAKHVKGKEAIRMSSRRGKKLHVDKGKSANVQDAIVSPQGVELPNKASSEPSKMEAAANAVNQPGRVAKNFGNLDLNVELINETEEPAVRSNQGNGSGRGEDDNIEGNGFFEGLDEFLSSLPILNVVRDDKVVKAA